jgi:integrase/recombinase XerC
MLATTFDLLNESALASYIDYLDRPGTTAERMLKNLRKFAAYLAYNGIKAPERHDVINYREWLAAPHAAITYDNQTGYRLTSAKLAPACKASTIRVYLTAVKSFFRWASWAGIYSNVAEGVRLPKVPKQHAKDALTVPEVGRIVDTMAKTSTAKIMAAQTAAKDRQGRINRATEQQARNDAMFTLMTASGLRCVEISRLRICDLEVRGNQAWLYVQGKGHADADTPQPVAKLALEKIKIYLEVRGVTDPHAPLFAATGNRSGGQALSTTSISKIVKAAMVDAGLNSARLTAHSLRHTAGNNCMEITENNIYLTQLYLRHQNPSTTEIYLHNQQVKESADIAEKITGALFGRAA